MIYQHDNLDFDKENTVVIPFSLYNFEGIRNNFFMYYDGVKFGISTQKDFRGIIEFPGVLEVIFNKFMREKKKKSKS